MLVVDFRGRVSVLGVPEIRLLLSGVLRLLWLLVHFSNKRGLLDIVLPVLRKRRS